MKKNTLLTLDSGLVELAKTRGINISGLVDNLLKSMLLGEGDPENILKTLDEMKNARYFGFSIQNLELKNVGPIKDFSAKFPKKLSLIIGPNSSGKTTIHKCISHMLSYESHPGIFSENSEANLKINDCEIVLKGENSSNVKLVLLDDVSRFQKDKIIRVIDYLNKAFNNPQIIINCTEDLKIPECECFYLKGKDDKKNDSEIAILENKMRDIKNNILNMNIKISESSKNKKPTPKDLEMFNRLKKELDDLQVLKENYVMRLETKKYEINKKNR